MPGNNEVAVIKSRNPEPVYNLVDNYLTFAAARATANLYYDGNLAKFEQDVQFGRFSTNQIEPVRELIKARATEKELVLYKNAEPKVVLADLAANILTPEAAKKIWDDNYQEAFSSAFAINWKPAQVQAQIALRELKSSEEQLEAACVRQRKALIDAKAYKATNSVFLTSLSENNIQVGQAAVNSWRKDVQARKERYERAKVERTLVISQLLEKLRPYYNKLPKTTVAILSERAKTEPVVKSLLDEVTFKITNPYITDALESLVLDEGTLNFDESISYPDKDRPGNIARLYL